jgi:hypothetical protein
MSMPGCSFLPQFLRKFEPSDILSNYCMTTMMNSNGDEQKEGGMREA